MRYEFWRMLLLAVIIRTWQVDLMLDTLAGWSILLQLLLTVGILAHAIPFGWRYYQDANRHHGCEDDYWKPHCRLRRGEDNYRNFLAVSISIFLQTFQRMILWILDACSTTHLVTYCPIREQRWT